MWRVSSPDGRRWVQYDGPDKITASVGLDPYLFDDSNAPIEVTAYTGQMYTPTGSADPLAVFLRARNAIGDNGLQVSGAAPRLPAPDFASEPDVVY